MHLSLAVFLAVVALASYEENGKWGFRDSRGVIVIPPRYEVAQEFSPKGIAAVVDAKGWGYIDKAGRMLLRPLVVDNGPDEFREGVARFKRDGKVGFFDEGGKVVIPPRYGHARPFFEGRAAVCEGCSEVADGEHRVVRGGKWGFIDRRGRLVIPLRFAEAGNFESGRARVRTGTTWQNVGRDGTVVRGR